MNESLIAEARKLVEDLAAQSARERELFETAYRLGFASGEEVGYRRAHVEMAAEWSQVAARVKALGKEKSPAQVELKRLRREPGGEIYKASLARHGGREYGGAAGAGEQGAA
ncbi:hypothetical protein GCM10009850_048030 [Nonomuraea monospora]|uniref:Uncharacterized protein n=1 Tax=Nonomuraea monospora TaxID=568818 RepID=A0ABN3CIQ4_9ACTN